LKSTQGVARLAAKCVVGNPAAGSFRGRSLASRVKKKRRGE